MERHKMTRKKGKKKRSTYHEVDQCLFADLQHEYYYYCDEE